jgi:hypothetical protein
MPKYVVHVGLPKTGSSYLQLLLKATSPQLAERKVLYPSVWWTKHNQSNHFELVSALRREETAALRPVFAGFDASGNNHIVLSAEGLSGLMTRKMEPLRALIGDNPCDIVIFIRRWSDWIPSHWQQRVKVGSKETFPELCARLIRVPPTRPIDFSSFLEELTAVFGHEALRLVSFSNLIDGKIDLFQYFCNTFISCNDIKVERGEGRVNESLTVYDTELNRCVNELELTRNRATSIATGVAVRRRADVPALKPVFETLFAMMKKYETVLELSDTQPAFAEITRRIQERWGDRIANPHPDHGLFEPRTRSVRYISPEYLLEDGARDAVLKLGATAA